MEGIEFMSDERLCAKHIYDWGAGRSCSRKAIVERMGQWYCKQHDPVEVAKRSEARRAKWHAEWDAESKAVKRRGEIAVARDRVVQAARAWARPSTGETTRNLRAAVEELEQLEQG